MIKNEKIQPRSLHPKIYCHIFVIVINYLFTKTNPLMKKILSALSIIALLYIAFAACKKDKPQTTNDKIIGVWNLDNYAFNYHHDGVDHPENETFGPTDVYEFRKDGTILQTIANESDSSTYSVIGGNKLSIADDLTYDIKTLTSNSLVLYYKIANRDEFVEITISFKR